jgi:AcrR family transcriptional regulator
MDRKIPLKPKKSQLQKRSRQTVEDILDAATRILKRDGLKGVTANKVAEEAPGSASDLSASLFRTNRPSFTVSISDMSRMSGIRSSG